LAFCAEERELAPKITMKELGIKWNLVKQQPHEYEKYVALVDSFAALQVDEKDTTTMVKAVV
jgi:hypothetical protein